jgi:hypothetical protein
MKSVAIKQKMHRAIDIIEDEDFLRAVHIILNTKSKEYEFELNKKKKVNWMSCVNNTNPVKPNRIQ